MACKKEIAEKQIKYCKDCIHFKLCNSKNPDIITTHRDATGCINYKGVERNDET